MASSSISIFARRLSVAAAPRLRLLAAPARIAFSTQSQKITDPNDTHMHDEFRILETMLEENLHMVDEDKVAELRALMKSAPIAVDAPDGETDGHLREEMLEIQAIFEDVAPHKEQINARLSKLQALIAEAEKTYAVDAPDGEVDGHLQEEMEEINHIIVDAAAHEDSAKIDRKHKNEKAVRKEQARDAEHDW